jgi:hypothetical protein
MPIFSVFAAVLLTIASGVPLAYAITRRVLLAVVLAPLVTGLVAAAATILMLVVGGRLGYWLVPLLLGQVAAAVVLLRRAREPTPHGRWVDIGWLVVPLTPPLLLVIMPPTQWDANSIWWLHAAYFTRDAGFARDALGDPLYWQTHPDYPPMLSSSVAAVWTVLGYDLYIAQFVSTTLTFSAITMLAYAVRVVTAAAPAGLSRFAGVAVGLAAWSTSPATVTGGLSDALWATSFAAGATVLLLGRDPFVRPATPVLPLSVLLLSVSALTKNEGFVAVIALAAFVTLRERRNLRRAWPVLLPVTAGLVWVMVSKYFGATSDLLGGGRFRELLVRDPVVLDRLDPILAATDTQVGDYVTVAATVALLAGLFLRRQRRAMGIGSDLWLWGIGGAYTISLVITYLISPNQITWHLATSIDRTTLAIALLACVSTLSWAVTAAGAPRPGTAGGHAANNHDTGASAPPRMENRMKLSILMPVYNEQARLPEAVRQALDVKYPCDIELIIVDDGSSDDTRQIIEQIDDARVRPVRHERNQGKGAAIRTAAQHTTGDYLIALDADLEYDPQDIPRLLKPVLDGRATVVYGSRTFGSHSSFSFWYVMGNKAVTTAANILFNCYVGDLETCFKLMPADLYRSLHIRSQGFGVEAEVTGKLLRRGIRPYEVPISYKARSRAQGKKITWRDGFQALKILTRERIRRPKNSPNALPLSERAG